MKADDWLGRKVVTQYGLVCKVQRTEGDLLLVSSSIREFWVEQSKTSLVMRNGEIVDPETLEVFGKVVIEGDHETHVLYEDSDPKSRLITADELQLDVQ